MSQRRILKPSKIEYVSHAVNFCDGCGHGCLYPCYARMMKRTPYHAWRHEPKPVSDAPELLRDQLTRIRKRPTEILVSSSHDAYQPNGDIPTRQVLEVLAEAEMPVWVLTKGCHPLPCGGGLLPVRDFDLLQGPGCRFGVTITPKTRPCVSGGSQMHLPSTTASWH